MSEELRRLQMLIENGAAETVTSPAIKVLAMRKGLLEMECRLEQGKGLERDEVQAKRTAEQVSLGGRGGNHAAVYGDLHGAGTGVGAVLMNLIEKLMPESLKQRTREALLRSFSAFARAAWRRLSRKGLAWSCTMSCGACFRS